MESCICRGSATQGQGQSIFEGSLLLFMHTPFDARRITKFDEGTHRERGSFLSGQPRPCPKWTGSQTSPILGVPFCLYGTLTQNDQIRHDNTCGKRCVFLEGQLRHCACINESHRAVCQREPSFMSYQSYHALRVAQHHRRRSRGDRGIGPPLLGLGNNPPLSALI